MYKKSKNALSFSCGNPGGFRKRLNIKLKGNYYRSTTVSLNFAREDGLAGLVEP